MKNYFLRTKIAMLMAIAPVFAVAQNINDWLPLDGNLDGYQSTYNSDTHVITYTGGWSTAGWDFRWNGRGYEDFSDFSSITLHLADITLTNDIYFIVKYKDDNSDIEVQKATSSLTYFTFELDPDKKNQIEYVMIKNGNDANSICITHITAAFNDELELPFEDFHPSYHGENVVFSYDQTNDYGKIDCPGANKWDNWIPWAFGDEGKDVSTYDYLIVELSEPTPCPISLEIKYNPDGTYNPTWGDAPANSGFVAVAIDKTVPTTVRDIIFHADGTAVVKVKRAFLAKNGKTTTWTGAVSGAWDLTGNWNHGVPVSGASDNVVIPSSFPGVSIPNETVLNTLTFAQGAEPALAGSLTVNEAVYVNYTLPATKKWSAIGFPFTVATVWSNTWEQALEAHGDASNRYWLQSFNGSTFSEVQSITGGTGYIIDFPSGYESESITFISDEGANFTNEAILPVNENYQLVANPSLATLTLSAEDENTYYYPYNGSDAFELLENATYDLKPFESVITIEKRADEQQSPTRTIPIVEVVTGIVKGGLTNDTVVATQYYTLQGIKINHPVKDSVYIVKKIHASQKVEVSKVIYK